MPLRVERRNNCGSVASAQITNARIGMPITAVRIQRQVRVMRAPLAHLPLPRWESVGERLKGGAEGVILAHSSPWPPHTRGEGNTNEVSRAHPSRRRQRPARAAGADFGLL